MEQIRWSRLLAGVVLIAFPVTLLGQAGAGWSARGAMPFERGEMTIAAANGKIYLISGNSRGVEANAFTQEYDPAAGTWREMALMPSVASHAGAVALNGKVYVVGGFVANKTFLPANRLRQGYGGPPKRVILTAREGGSRQPRGNATM